MTDAHVHHYVPKGTGQVSRWAECDGWHEIGPRKSWLPCREKLAGENGPIVGSMGRIEAACMVANVGVPK